MLSKEIKAYDRKALKMRNDLARTPNLKQNKNFRDRCEALEREGMKLAERVIRVEQRMKMLQKKIK